MSGNAQPLTNALEKKVKEERAEAEKQTSQSFPNQSRSDLRAALNNDSYAISRIAKNITDKQFSQYKEQVEVEVARVQKVVPNEKQEIRKRSINYIFPSII